MPPVSTGLNTEQVNKLKGMGGIDQTLLNAYKPSGPIKASVSADALVEQPKPMTVPEPAQANIPSNTLNVARNVSRDTDGFIAAQTEEAAKLKELQATYGALGNEGSLADLFTNKQADYGVTPESFKELKDIQLQLTDMDTKSGLNKVTIESGGQGAIQGQRSLTQEDREAAVRSASLAARASVLQGNIETATALAKDAVNIAYQDRTLKAQNLLNQIEMVQGQVDDQTAQLLEQEKRAYEAELASVAEVKDAISNAMVNGATQSEMAQLTDPTIDDETKKTLAQSIIARGSNEMRGLEMESKRASIAREWAQTAKTQADTLIALAESGDPDAIAKLGYDPNEINGDARQYETQKTDIQMGIGAAEAMLKNWEGINLSTGAFQSPLLAAATQSIGGGAAGGFALGTVVPGIGNAVGTVIGTVAGLAASPFYYSRTKTKKDEALAAASFLINDSTFKEIIDLKAQGVTFGQMTEGERIAAGRAASQLAAAAETDESGKVIGFRGGADTIKQHVNDILVAYQGRQEYLDKQYAITPDEESEAADVWGSNQ